jgi:putative membrane protein
MSWGTVEGDKSIRAAITDIESTSAVEVVVAVRAHARLFLVQHVVVGLIAMIAVLVYAVVAEWDAWAVIALPLAAGVISTLLVEYVPPLYRFLVPAWVREQHVAEAARALFVEKKVHTTRARTGMLVFVAVRARAVEVIGDVGIVEQLGQTRLDHMAQALKAALPQGPAAVGRTLANFGPELADVFPKQADDTNELPDDPIAVTSE